MRMSDREPDPTRAPASARAQILVAVLIVALALGTALLVAGFSDRTQPVTVELVSNDPDTAPTVAGRVERVLTCPGAFASMDGMGAYYPVDGRLVWPDGLGAQPRPCTHDLGRLRLALGAGVVLSAATVALVGATLVVRRRNRPAS